MDKIVNFARSEDGGSLAEYGLIAILVAIVVMVATTTIGEKVSSFFTDASGLFK